MLVPGKIIFNANTYKYGFPYCGPMHPPGHYVRKSELFWFSGSEKIFK
jgi:hypothetical protein